MSARTAWNRHPRWGLAVRATAAAVIAFPVALLVPDPWNDYPYYAPLGAVVATSVTLRSSARESFQAVGAIMLGALVARSADVLVPSMLLSLAVTILVAALLSGLRVLGSMGSWVTTSALFVLIVGNTDPVGYVGAYVGLTFLGALVGIGVNLVVPPLPLTPATLALHDLRRALASQLDDLASASESEEPLSAEDWEAHRHPVRADALRVEEIVERAAEATSGSWTARRHAQWRARQVRQSEALWQVAHRVMELADLVVESETADLRVTRLRGSVRSAAVEAFRAAGGAVGTIDRAGTEELDAAREALEAFRERVSAARADASYRSEAAAAMILALERILDACTRAEPPDEV